MQITVFTPTYNRAYIIRNLYESLCRQTFTDFEWLVVDDGSTDGTDDLFRVLTGKRQIPVRYIRTPNGGKHRAINRGVSEARGELFFIVDSDDFLTDNALELVSGYYAAVRGDKRFAGVCGMKAYPDNRRVGGENSYSGVLDCSLLEQEESYHVKGDKAQIYRTDVLGRYPFPDYAGERFCLEGVVWNRIDREYKMRFFFENIYVCEYLEDGLTRNKIKILRNSPRYCMLAYKELACDGRCRITSRIRYAAAYWRYTLAYRGSREKELRLPFWAFLFYPVGAFFFFRDSLTLNK